ncbi:unnamed protein product [Brachionus calyciflorus]|uniref:Uncharacterized protein n=1 Tax=Brachionus calyciflorus TaxID=104777 RepID=A0A813PLB2_9BILA|nr:unnamed protein product [Brachionus calyciflorus]
MQAHNETNKNPKNTKEVTKATSVSGYGNLNDWKYTKLNIGIFGDVNDDLKQVLIDKLTSYGPQALSLDIRYRIFEHRNNSRLQVWDLNPDKEINQTNFDYFLSQNNLNSFDILILFRKDTFTDFDQKISDYLKSKGFTVLLVFNGISDFCQKKNKIFL